MLLEKFKNSVKTPALAAALTLAPIGAFSTASHADGAQCGPLYQTSTGREVDASYSAHRYSQQHVGAVGISIFPGADLGSYSGHDLGTKIVSALKINGVDAECFVHNNTHSNGTSVNFHITGLAWKEDGALNISQSLARDTLRGVIAEAKTARELLAHKGGEPLAALD